MILRLVWLLYGRIVKFVRITVVIRSALSKLFKIRVLRRVRLICRLIRLLRFVLASLVTMACSGALIVLMN